MTGTPSGLGQRIELSREESGEETVVAVSRDVEGADISRVGDGGSLVCISVTPSLSVAIVKAFCNLDDLNALSSVCTSDLLAGAENLVGSRGSTVLDIIELALNLGTFFGEGRGGCLKLFDEL